MKCSLRFLVCEITGKGKVIYMLASVLIHLTHSASSNIKSLPNFPLIHIDFTISVKCILVALDNMAYNIKQLVLINCVKAAFDINSCKI
jgi:hypothetical protein